MYSCLTSTNLTSTKLNFACHLHNFILVKCRTAFALILCRTSPASIGLTPKHLSSLVYIAIDLLLRAGLYTGLGAGGGGGGGDNVIRECTETGEVTMLCVLRCRGVYYCWGYGPQ